MESVCDLHDIRQNLLNCSYISAGTVTRYCFYMFILKQPLLQNTAFSSVKYSNRSMGSFIHNDSSVSMPFLKAKSSTPIVLPHFTSSCKLKTFCEQMNHSVPTYFEVHSFAKYVNNLRSWLPLLMYK